MEPITIEELAEIEAEYKAGRVRPTLVPRLIEAVRLLMAENREFEKEVTLLEQKVARLQQVKTT